MQFKKIIPILGLSLLGGLASCNNESETYEVLFSNLQTGENFKINVPKGETIYDVTTDTSELDDFISDVRMSEFSNFTEKIKMFQRDKEKGRTVEWGEEEEMPDGTDRDDWD